MTTLDALPDYESLLIDTAIENWRLSRLFVRVTAKLDSGEATRYGNQLRFSLRRLEETLDAAGLVLVNVEGLIFDPGMAASALNIGDFEPEDALMVDQMLEPIIMGRNGLRRAGTVMLRKATT